MSKKEFINGRRRGFVDVFQEFMIQKSTFDGFWEIPVVPNNVYRTPKRIIPYDQRKNVKGDLKDTFIHFYIDDQKFDGPFGIWIGATRNLENKRGFSLSSIKKYGGIIGPDFSLGFGFPLCKQLDSVRRTRYFESWMASLGVQVIPNVRWTDERSYDFCFLGLPKRGVVAISTLGVLNHKIQRKYFKLGLVELLKRVDPTVIVVYGLMPKDIFDVVDNTRTKIINFESETSKHYGGKNGKS